MFLTVPLSILTIFLLVARIYYERFVRDRRIPPGPPRLPILGNLHQAPKPHQLPWHIFASWAQQYGPIFSAQFGGSLFVFLADETTAHDLLNKRGNRYSDRPRCIMANECQEKGMHIMFRSYDNYFKRHQRMEAQVLTPKASATYSPAQDLETKKMLFDFLSQPDKDFVKHFERFAFSIVHFLTYGIRAEVGDEMIHTVQKIEDDVVEAGDSAKWIVDIFPVLNSLPKVLAPWKKIADANFEFQKTFFLKNMRYALESKSWSWTKVFAQSPDAKTMSEVELAFDLGILAMAGLATTSVTLQVFVLAAVSSLDIMATAQKELDEVVGSSRLPTLEDQSQLPFVTAVMKEVFRWHAMLPFAFPHYVAAEDEYMGYRIPAGSTILGLQWCMNHDDRNFPNPDTFNPSRWLEPGAEELKYHAFGFGRRICPGRYVAENSVFLSIARLLWAYNIRAPEGWQYDAGAWEPRFFTRPLGLKARFSVRSAAHERLIHREWHAMEGSAEQILDEIQQHRNRA